MPVHADNATGDVVLQPILLVSTQEHLLHVLMTEEEQMPIRVLDDPARAWDLLLQPVSYVDEYLHG